MSVHPVNQFLLHNHLLPTDMKRGKIRFVQQTLHTITIHGVIIISDVGKAIKINTFGQNRIIHQMVSKVYLSIRIQNMLTVIRDEMDFQMEK